AGGYSQPSCGLPSPCGVGALSPWHYGHLAQPASPYAVAPRYYYVNQGPTYTGPGLLAPAPTYQERAVSGWYGYGPTAYGPSYQYNGGPYSNATTHYYDGMPAQTGYYGQSGYYGQTGYSMQPAYTTGYNTGYQVAPGYPA